MVSKICWYKSSLVETLDPKGTGFDVVRWKTGGRIWWWWCFFRPFYGEKLPEERYMSLISVDFSMNFYTSKLVRWFRPSKGAFFVGTPSSCIRINSLGILGPWFWYLCFGFGCWKIDVQYIHLLNGLWLWLYLSVRLLWGGGDGFLTGTKHLSFYVFKHEIDQWFVNA